MCVVLRGATRIAVWRAEMGVGSARPALSSPDSARGGGSPSNLSTRLASEETHHGIKRWGGNKVSVREQRRSTGKWHF